MISGTAGLVLVTAVIAAGVAALVVMGAYGIRVEGEGAGEKSLHGGVGRGGDTGVELNAGLGQGGPGAAADAAADESVHAPLRQEPGQGPVAAALGVMDLGGDHLVLRHVVDLELSAVAEMLEHLAVLVSDRDLHESASFDLALW